MKLIPLTRGVSAKVDEEDFEKFGGMKWYASFCKSINNFYACRKTKKIYYLHRVIMGSPEGMVVDHINHDTLDNRRENLRICTQNQNMMNRIGSSSHSKSGIRGVYWHKRAGKWTSQIHINGKAKHLGLFVSVDEAIASFAEANKKYYGDFGGIL